MNSITTLQICCFVCAHMQTFLTFLKWNLSIKDTLNQAHLSNEDSAAQLCTNLPQMNWGQDTSVQDSQQLGPNDCI